MKKLFLSVFSLYILISVSGSLFAIGERTITIGGSSSWRIAEYKTGITEVRSVRPYPVLALSSASGASVSGYQAASGVLGTFLPMSSGAVDIALSFDESQTALFADSARNYRLQVPSAVEAAGRLYARAGSGAALFNRSSSNNSAIIIEPYSYSALFAPGNRLRDFTIEFWLYPFNMENGERILSWVAANRTGAAGSVQRITCSVTRNRMQWSFVNFFTSVSGASNINIELTGSAPIVPKTWSHHLIRFDASTGMLEYLVDGAIEAIAYATATGRENSEVYTPVTGSGGHFLLGDSFSGIMDEFKIHSAFAGRSSVQRYNPQGGRIETGVIDLGEYSSGLVRIDVTGGRYNINASGSHIVFNEYRENGRFRFSDDSEINFFIRAGDDPWQLNSARWVNFTPGTDVSGIKGRYVQIAADLYPSSDGEASPYIDELKIIYIPGEPPMPPRNLTAVASDGAVTLRWRYSPDEYTEGYLVYYSTVRDELFGEGALLGSSPINVGMTNTAYIEGLSNGTLYYFRVAAYNRISGGKINIGEFSAEVTARPLAGLFP